MLNLRRATRLQQHNRTGKRVSFVGLARPVSTREHTPDIESDMKEWHKRAVGGASRFPDFIDNWNRKRFFRYGIGMSAVTGGLCVLNTWIGAVAVVPVALYWYIGYKDINQTTHAIRRNFPVLGNMRYLLESIRPEIHQYFIEGEESTEGAPFSRSQRSLVYQRSKKMLDTKPFGTARNYYDNGYEFINHSIWPKTIEPEQARVVIGSTRAKPYSASIFNISAMSYGALSDNAILSLNKAAQMGNFYHNTGEGGVSRFHLQPGGAIVWNIGTGYFGCRDQNGNFSEERFVETATKDNIKMIELKLSQGAKPGKGGILPGNKVTEAIAEARGVKVGEDCVSPPIHSAFSTPTEMMHFIERLRQLSGNKPVGFKLCIGHVEEFCGIVQAMLHTGILPDFITVDGGEGGTGAAPVEYSNHVGTSLVDGLTLVNNTLRGANIRDQITVIAAGKVLSAFSLVKTLALGADVCNAARAYMFALGCIQSLKCNSNKCPTGIATQNPELMKGLVVGDKSFRVYNYHEKTVEMALALIGSAGLTSPTQLSPSMVMKREGAKIHSFEQIYPTVPVGCLLEGTAPQYLQRAWNHAQVRFAIE